MNTIIKSKNFLSKIIIGCILFCLTPIKTYAVNVPIDEEFFANSWAYADTSLGMVVDSLEQLGYGIGNASNLVYTSNYNIVEDSGVFSGILLANLHGEYLGGILDINYDSTLSSSIVNGIPETTILIGSHGTHSSGARFEDSGKIKKIGKNGIMELTTTTFKLPPNNNIPDLILKESYIVRQDKMPPILSISGISFRVEGEDFVKDKSVQITYNQTTTEGSSTYNKLDKDGNVVSTITNDCLTKTLPNINSSTSNINGSTTCICNITTTSEPSILPAIITLSIFSAISTLKQKLKPSI
jgi:hypothetical protein